MKIQHWFLSVMLLLPLSKMAAETEVNVPVEILFEAKKGHTDSFNDVQLDVVVIDPKGAQMIVPAFWAGGKQCKLRYASPILGAHRFRTQCSDAEDAGLHGIEGSVEIGNKGL